MILIALGSNLGDREEHLAHARAALIGYDVELVAESATIETPALLPEGAPAEWNIPYLNQVIAVRTHLLPMELLTVLKLIETELGRKKREHWGPREIDLDIIAYADEVMVTDTLTIPHPHMDTRRFVLKPLVEIAPDWLHPIFGKTARQLLTELP